MILNNCIVLSHGTTLRPFTAAVTIRLQTSVYFHCTFGNLYNIKKYPEDFYLKYNLPLLPYELLPIYVVLILPKV